MSNNLIPVARLVKPRAGLSKTETAAQGFCEVSRAKLMKQKACMLAWDLLHWSLLRAYLTEVLSRKAGPAPSAAQLSTSQCLAPILGTFANCLVYIYTLSQPSLQERSNPVVLAADNALMKQSTQMVSYQLTLKKSSVIVPIFFPELRQLCLKICGIGYAQLQGHDAFGLF